MSPEPSVARRRVIVVMAVAELLAMSLWFSATAAAPELAVEWGLTPTETAWLTIAVQLGFVAGALLSSVLTLSDVIPPRYLFAGSAVVGAGATALIALAVGSALPAIALRFLTGTALAGVYPPGMKLMAGWFRAGRGFAIGVLVGSLTVGSALPHLIRAAGGFLLTTVSIQLVPVFVELVGWRWAFTPLALGPAAGTLSMLRPRGLPAAAKLAGGRD